MDFIYQNSIKYVDIEQVAEFLEYKRVKQFVNRVKSKVELLNDKFIEVKELIKQLIKSTRNKINELIDIVLKEEQQKEIDDIIDKFNEETNNEYEWINTQTSQTPKILINMWFILSAFNINIVDENFVNKYINIYKLNIDELEELFVMYMQKLPYNTLLDTNDNVIWNLNK